MFNVMNAVVDGEKSGCGGAYVVYVAHWLIFSVHLSWARLFSLYLTEHRPFEHGQNFISKAS